jgi:hypothetical protein
MNMTFDLSVGMKIYDNAWFLRDGLEPEAAADRLKSMGVTWVIAQSKLLPMANSAVESAVSESELARYQALDDLHFRNLLRDRGISYFAVLNICFDPRFASAHPELLPVDQFGRVEEMQDWYIGLPPDRDENIAHKIGLLEAAVAALNPDGVHLGFIRWPGFWETWLDDVRRDDMPDYCYSPRTLGTFAAEQGVDIPVHDPIAAAVAIRDRYRRRWSSWKCGKTFAAIGKIKEAVQKAGGQIPISINTLPFFRDEFEGAVEDVFGQDVARLRDVVDVFEVMAYHQILRKDAQWPAEVAGDIKRRSGQRTVCTIQAKPLYLDGMHAGRGRSSTLDAAEFRRAVDAVEKSEIDGLCLFTFDDFLALQGTADGLEMIGRIRNFRR